MSLNGGNPDSAVPPSPTPNPTSDAQQRSSQLSQSLANLNHTVESRSVRVRQETHNNLRQASIALEAAYQRITQLRHNINHLLNRMPPGFAEFQLPANDSGIGPSHSALLLTGAPNSVHETDPELLRRASRLRELVPSSARQRLEDFETNSRQIWGTRDENAQSNRIRSQRWDSSSDPPSQTLPSRALPPMRRGWVTVRTSTIPGTYTASSDDPSTMIGRRVAARTTPSSSDNSSGTLPTEPTHNRAAEVARDLENMRDRLIAHRARRFGIAQRLDNTLSAGQGSESNRDNGIRHRISTTEFDIDTTEALPSSDDTLPPPLTIDGINNEQIFEDVLERDIIDSSIERNLRRQGSMVVVSPARVEEESTFPVRRRLDEGDDRRVQIHRETLDNVREQHILGVSIDSRERGGGFQLRLPRRRTAGWPPQPTAVDVTIPADERSSSSTRRRRGWARLNADGDEVPSDEEEELERTRARLRMRLSHPDGRGIEDTFVPYTRIPIPPPNELEHNVARVHINPTTGLSTPSGMCVSTKDELSAQHTHIPLQFYLDPLPTPLVQMMPPSVTPARISPRIITVPKHASLAGR